MSGDLCCPVLELRQYTLHPGQRDVLIDLFDREFVETQEAAGIRVVGQFRDEDRPDRFVWVRGFPDMPSRARALEAFYGGPVWAAHRAAANATMIDSDDVLLLRPVDDSSGFPLPAPDRPVRRPTGRTASLVTVTLHHRDRPVDEEFVRFFASEVEPVLLGAGAAPVARLVTEPAENTFPRLPVRTGEQVFAWFARFADADAHRRHLARLADDPAWTRVSAQLAGRLTGPPEQLRLSPTARSLLR